MRRALMVTALAVALSAPIASASADSTVTVPGLSFPASDTYLTYFGCDDLYHANTTPPRVRIDRGSAPAGTRSFGLLMPGDGTASGPVHAVTSVADTTVAAFSARSAAGSTGVAYVWYVTSKLAPGQVWAGRADLSLGSAWQTVDARSTSYSWQLVTAATGEVVRDAGTATMGSFTRKNGDGPGYLLAGFGCNGQEFSIDRLRYGSPGSVTTYDLEGIRAMAEMRPPSESKVPAGDPVTITGSAVDATGTPIGAAMVLQAKPEGAADFKAVGDAISESNDGLVRKVVRPDTTTTYRWYLPAMGYADATWSDPVTVEVPTDETDPAPDPGDEPTDAPSTEGSPSDSGGDTVEVPPLPTPAPSDEPSEGPGDEPTDAPSEQPSEQPTDAPSDQPSDPPSDAPATPTP